MITDEEFTFLTDILKRDSGLALTKEKTYLLESRLLPLATERGIEGGFAGLIQNLRTGDAVLKKAVIEAMTTNETSFFRDGTPFENLKEHVLPFMMKARGGERKLRIWSAACSSGQEPYSTAMLFKEHPLFSTWDIKIIATDLSDDILAQAKSGTYTQFEVQRGLPIQLLVKYFTQEGDKWVAKPELKSMIDFRPLNLLGDFGLLGSFDIVFCRNVLIYFDVPTKSKVFDGIKKVLKKDGVLFLGGAETVIGITKVFTSIPKVRGLYVRDDTEFGDAAPAASPSAVAAGS